MKGDRPLLPVGWAYPLERRETAAGFGSRLAALNGRPLRYFLREMEIAPRSLDKGEEAAIRALAILGNADGDALIRHTPSPLDTKFYGVADEKLGRLAINRTYFRFCPLCVREDLERYDGPMHTRPWLRLEWTISHFRSCQKHHVFLESTQPVRRPFEPFDFIETLGELLPGMETRAANAPKAAPSPFQSWVSDRFDGRRDDGNWLDDLPLYVGASFCEALGLSALHEPKVRTSALTERDWTAAADEGFRIASAGESSLRELLGRLNDAQSSTRGFWGPRDTYGYAYGLLQKTVDDPAYAKLRDAVRRFALETMPIEPGTDVLGETAGNRRIHTVRTASRDSGVHALTIRRLFQRMGIAGDRAESGLMDHRVLVDSTEVERLLSALKTALTAPEVEELLGVPRIHLNELVSGGYLPALAGTGTRANAKRRFSREDVEKLRSRLFEGAAEVEDPGSRQVDISGARRAATCSIPDLLEMIFTGKLRWKGRLAGRTDYMGLLLDADEVTRLVRSRETKTGLTREETLDYIPGMGRASVQALIDGGQLKTIEEFNPEARRMSTLVSRESADAFKATYVALGELTRTTRLHHKKVRLLLRGVGIEAALDPAAVGAFFYQRAEVEQAQQADPGFWKYDKNSAQARGRARKRCSAGLADCVDQQSDKTLEHDMLEPPRV